MAIKKETKDNPDVTDFLTDKQKDKLWVIHYAKMLESGIPASTIFRPVYLMTTGDHDMGTLRFNNLTTPPTVEEINGKDNC